MTAPRSVAVLVGSLRRESLSRRVAQALIDRSPRSVHCEIVEIRDLPLYDEDLDDSPPAAWTRFRGALNGADAVLFVTPEYNRSIPGGLKNAMDVGSRPEGRSVFAGKPAAVVSVTPYKMGAFGANHALRQTLVYLNMPAMQQPEAYVGSAAELFDHGGRVKASETAKLLEGFMGAFARWIEAAGGPPVDDFDAFMKRRDSIANAYVCGDPSPLRTIAARAGSATFFPPRGGVVSGAEDVFSRYEKDAHVFEGGGVSRFDVLQSGAGDTLAFWTGFQNAEAHLRGRDGKTPMKLRVTEVFRRVDGEWKLVHRHVDGGAE